MENLCSIFFSPWPPEFWDLVSYKCNVDDLILVTKSFVVYRTKWYESCKTNWKSMTIRWRVIKKPSRLPVSGPPIGAQKREKLIYSVNANQNWTLSLEFHCLDTSSICVFRCIISCLPCFTSCVNLLKLHKIPWKRRIERLYPHFNNFLRYLCPLIRLSCHKACYLFF
jgi:hypothetical protein